MVFNRQAVKEKFEKDVRDKILQTQLILNHLKAALSDVEKNSATAKQDVQKATDSIIQQLENRKLMLTREIDLLSQPQIVSLQERIHSTFVTLGSLQSTLDNLDSFDYNCLRLPAVTWPINEVQSDLKIEVPTESLNEVIGKWGSVKVKGELNEGLENQAEQQQRDLSETCTVLAPSSSSLKSLPVTTNKPIQCKKAMDFMERFGSSKENQRDPKDFQIEKWLCGMKIQQQSNESDDFEMLSDAEPIVKPLSECNKTSSCIELGTNNNNNVDKVICDAEDGSSIVCVESDFDVCSDDEIGKWLKPKKQKRNSVSSPCSISSEIMQTYLYKSKTPINDRHIDFPCLRLDPNTWVPKRKATATDKYTPITNTTTTTTTTATTKNANLHHIKDNFELSLRLDGMIPPTFALPSPFWLKKY